MSIYIPICFYFNVYKIPREYRSIQRFTFQYVSILMPIAAGVCAYIILNLHSNMFLF
mgnify:CR=1 FL=1